MVFKATQSIEEGIYEIKGREHHTYKENTFILDTRSTYHAFRENAIIDRFKLETSPPEEGCLHLAKYFGCADAGEHDYKPSKRAPQKGKKIFYNTLLNEERSHIFIPTECIVLEIRKLEGDEEKKIADELDEVYQSLTESGY